MYPKMLLRVVCQICGRTGIVDTENLVDAYPRWEHYLLQDLIDDDVFLGVFKDFEIWICPECHKKIAEFSGLRRDETGEYYEDWVINWEKLGEMVRKSLEGELGMGEKGEE